jgi:hypothetical protein
MPRIWLVLDLGFFIPYTVFLCGAISNDTYSVKISGSELKAIKLDSFDSSKFPSSYYEKYLSLG